MRPERRLSGQNGRGGVSRPVMNQPFWRNCGKSRGRRGRAPVLRRVMTMPAQLRSTILELGGRKISKSRVQPFLIIDMLKEFANTGVTFVEVTIFVAVHLFRL